MHVVLSLEMDHGGGELVYVGEQHGLADPKNALCQEVSVQLCVGEREGGGRRKEGGRDEDTQITTLNHAHVQCACTHILMQLSLNTPLVQANEN